MFIEKLQYSFLFPVSNIYNEPWHHQYVAIHRSSGGGKRGKEKEEEEEKNHAQKVTIDSSSDNVEKYVLIALKKTNYSYGQS